MLNPRSSSPNHDSSTNHLSYRLDITTTAPADAENGKKPTIALTEFVEACSIGEQVSTAELGALFDRDRTVGVLETLFTDGKMRALVGKAPVVRGAPLLEPAVELKEMGAEEAIPAPAAEAEAPAEDNQA